MIGFDRRQFLAAAAATLAWPIVARSDDGPKRDRTAQSALGARALDALSTSPYVYVSPLLASGRESTCHGEVWFAWLDGSVVTSTSTGSWKARSIEAGRQRARLWVGDHGRWKGVLGRNESFRRAPSFLAEGRFVAEPGPLLDRLLAVYEVKYPGEIARWRDRMRREVADAERVVIRYAPVVG